MADSAVERDDIIELAEQFVAAGRVVPGLTVDHDGRGRSWWWPLPTGGDRARLARLLGDETVEAQIELADALGLATDSIVRRRLVHAGAALVPRRPGRPTVPEAWIRSLCSPDPLLPPSLSPDRVRGLAADVTRWVETGAAVPTSVELCLRVSEPTDLVAGDGVMVPQGPWRIEVLVRDAHDSALMAPLGSLLSPEATVFAPTALEDGLAALASAVRVAPELASVFDDGQPDVVEIDAETLLELVQDRHQALSRAGVHLLLPSWWANGDRLGLRAKSSSSSSSEGSGSGFGLEELVEFSWEAALGDEVLTEAEVQELAAAAAAKQTLVRYRGQWIELDASRIDAILRRLGETAETTAGELLRAGLGLGLDTLDADDLDVVEVEDAGWIGRLLRDAASRRVEPIVAPDGFVGELRPYQQRGVGWLAFLGRLGLGACLADDMGLGKTAQLIGSLLVDDVVGPSLVVCPVSVLGNWERELHRFAPRLRVLAHHGPARERHDPEVFADQLDGVDVMLTTYSLLHRDQALMEPVSWATIVLDEAQQIKNPGTKATRAARALRGARRVALTGTPVENHLVELWSIMTFLNPGLLGTVAEFKERFALPIQSRAAESDGAEGSTADNEVTDGDAAADLLGRVTAPFILRRLKTDRSIITDLPDKIETVDLCPLTREQVSLYQSLADDLLARANEADGMERRGLVLSGLTRLKQVCNHPAHFLDDGSNLPRRSGKLERCEELVEELVGAGDKALCFTQYTAWGDRLAPYLEARFGVRCSWLHGGVARPDRDAMIEQFSETDGPALMILSLRAGGTGLNLTAASHVIHYDRWWNPAVEDQATDRAYRIGQTRMVQVHKLVSVGTIEERVDRMISDKKALADRVVGTGESWLSELSTDELASVIQLSASGDSG